jgi:hypothetical protein
MCGANPAKSNFHSASQADMDNVPLSPMRSSRESFCRKYRMIPIGYAINGRLSAALFAKEGLPSIGRFERCFFVAKIRGARNLNGLPRRYHAPFGPEFSAVSIREHNAQILTCSHLVVAVGFDRGFCRANADAAARRHAGGAEGLYPRRTEVLSFRNESGRLYRAGLPAAKSSEAVSPLQSGFGDPRAIGL